MTLATCSVETCDEPVKAKGYCKSHYAKAWRYGDPLYKPPVKVLQRCKVITADGTRCPELAKKKGMCVRHYKRAERHNGDPLGGRVDEAPPYEGQLCSIVLPDGTPCPEAAVKRGWCGTHYARWRAHGDPNWQRYDFRLHAEHRDGGAPHIAVPVHYKGSPVVVLVDEADYERLSSHRWAVTKGGYVQVFVRGVGRRGRGIKGAGQTILLHRVVMGCTKGDGLVVDHINGERLDNRRSNLRVVSVQQNRQNVAGYGKYSMRRGVSYNTARGHWIAYGKIPGGPHMTLGRFATEEQAAAVAAAFRAEHMPYAVAR